MMYGINAHKNAPSVQLFCPSLTVFTSRSSVWMTPMNLICRTRESGNLLNLSAQNCIIASTVRQSNFHWAAGVPCRDVWGRAKN